MKKTLTLLVVGTVLSCTAQAQLLTEHFAYNNGSLGSSGIGSSVWTGGDSPSTAIQVNSAADLPSPAVAGFGAGGSLISNWQNGRRFGFCSLAECSFFHVKGDLDNNRTLAFNTFPEHNSLKKLQVRNCRCVCPAVKVLKEA